MSIVSKTTKRYSGFSPLSIPGCGLWLDAADSRTLTLSGNNVTAWNDKSGNGRNVIQNTASQQPTYSNTRVNFVTASSQYLQNTTSFSITNTYTIFGVGRQSTSSLGRIVEIRGNPSLVAGFDFGSNYNIFSGNTTDITNSQPTGNTNQNIAVIVRSVPSAQYILNGGSPVTMPSVAAAFTGQPNTFTVGAAYAVGATGVVSGFERFLNGFVNEIIVYDTALSSNSRQQVEGYLAAKWGLISGLPATHPFKSVRPFTQAFQPVDITGCQLWLDAADATTITFGTGSNISQWNDKSGNGNHATQGTDGNRPVYSSTNRNLSFTRTSSHFLNLPNSTLPSGNNSYGYFIVCTWAQAIDGLGIIGGGNYGTTGQVFALRSTGTNRQIVNYWWGNDIQTGNSAYTVNTPLIVECTYTSGGTRAILTNGTQLVSDTPAARNQGTGNNTIGRTWPGGNEFHDGTISEIIVYNVALTTSQRQQLEGYLAYKWGLRTNLPSTQPFKLYPPLSVAFTPVQISGLNIWLDAADNSKLTLSGTNVTQWIDKSANGYTFTVTGTNPVLTTTFNGSYPSVRSTNTNTSLSASIPISNVLSATGYSIFVVGKITSGVVFMIMNDATNVWKIADIEYAGGSLVNVKCFSAGANLGYDPRNPFIMSLTYVRGSTFTAYFNANAAYSASTATAGTLTGNSSFILFYGGTGYGSVSEASEVVVYNTLLSTSERQVVEGYLAHKWGLLNSLPSTHPYKKIRP